MVTIIKKGTSVIQMKKQLKKAFSKAPKRDIRKYAGVLKTDVDQLKYQ